MTNPLFRILASHPRLGSLALLTPVLGLRYGRWLWCQRRPVGVFDGVIGLRRTM